MEKRSQSVKTTPIREEILQAMIVSFRMEGIQIPQHTAYTILEKVNLRLKMQKK